MGYIFDYKDARGIEAEMGLPKAVLAMEMENSLMLRMLKPEPGETVLDIGCGMGFCLETFLRQGLRATGIDASAHMVEKAGKRVENKAELYQGFAEDLPFDDNAFNYATIVHTIEFVDDAKKVIEEACRVAKDKVYIGILNKYSVKGIRYAARRYFIHDRYREAKFYGSGEVLRIIKSLSEDFPVYRGTICHPPSISGDIGRRISEYDLTRKYPFGSFAGILVIPVPKFRTTPLQLRYHADSHEGIVAG